MPRRKGQHQGEPEKEPGRQEFPDDRLPGGDRHRQQQFNRAHAPFFRPQPHADRRHQEQIKPRMPIEERSDQRGFAALEKAADHER